MGEFGSGLAFGLCGLGRYGSILCRWTGGCQRGSPDLLHFRNRSPRVARHGRRIDLNLTAHRIPPTVRARLEFERRSAARVRPSGGLVGGFVPTHFGVTPFEFIDLLLLFFAQRRLAEAFLSRFGGRFRFVVAASKRRRPSMLGRLEEGRRPEARLGIRDLGVVVAGRFLAVDLRLKRGRRSDSPEAFDLLGVRTGQQGRVPASTRQEQASDRVPGRG